MNLFRNALSLLSFDEIHEALSVALFIYSERELTKREKVIRDILMPKK